MFKDGEYICNLCRGSVDCAGYGLKIKRFKEIKDRITFVDYTKIDDAHICVPCMLGLKLSLDADDKKEEVNHEKRLLCFVRQTKRV